MTKQEPAFDSLLLAAKLLDAEQCLLPVELDPDEADGAGAFFESALSVGDALESVFDDLVLELLP